jgi:hypothetical protein
VAEPDRDRERPDDESDVKQRRLRPGGPHPSGLPCPKQGSRPRAEGPNAAPVG